MAHLTGLFKRGASFYLRVVLPDGHPLRGQYRNGCWVKSLGCRTHREAVRVGTIKRAEVLGGLVLSQEQPQNRANAPVSTAQSNTPPSQVQARHDRRTLRAVFGRWKTSGATPRSNDSISAYRRAVDQFEGQHPGKELSDFNGDLGDQYRAWLLENCNTPKTARDRLTAIKSLLKYATETLEWLPKQPWHGLDIKATTTNKRRPWTSSEVQTFFHSPLYQQGVLPDHPYAGQHAAYWIPLLGLYSGARLGELCQLQTQDVQTLEGIPVLVLTDEGEGQSIKSEAGHRSVPIHSELIRLGFLDYVDSIRSSGKGSLWPSLKLRDGKPSDYFGRWFKNQRHSLGLVETRPDFHCFRHTVRPLMRQAGFSEETQDKVTGHKAHGSVGTVVYGHWTLQEIQAAVEAIRYQAVIVPRCKSFFSTSATQPLADRLHGQPQGLLRKNQKS